MSQLSTLSKNSLNNVIGPFTQPEWNAMLGTKKSIAYMKKTDRVFYAEAIDMEIANLKEDFKRRVA